MINFSIRKLGPQYRYTMRMLPILTHTHAILPLASITSSKATATQINTSRQDAQITFAAIQGHDAATNNTTETTEHRSDQVNQAQRIPHITTGMLTFFNQVPMMNRYQISSPILLQGPRYYVDASVMLDQPVPNPRLAGLGVFILNTQAHPVQSIYIKARFRDSTSVLMAEAASLALAAQVIQRLNITNCNFLSDCEQLVHFLNMADHSDPPDWRIKPFTAAF